MAKILAKYSLEGWYNFRGIGKQSGEVSYCDDGKVLGYISDVDPSRRSIGTKKLIIGYRSEDGKSLDFLKITPSTRSFSDIMPILWSMVSKKVIPSTDGLEKFGGIWATAEGLPSVSYLENIMATKGDVLDVNNLLGLDVGVIRESWMLGNVPKDLVSLAKEYSQIGEITLTRQP